MKKIIFLEGVLLALVGFILSDFRILLGIAAIYILLSFTHLNKIQTLAVYFFIPILGFVFFASDKFCQEGSFCWIWGDILIGLTTLIFIVLGFLKFIKILSVKNSTKG